MIRTHSIVLVLLITCGVAVPVNRAADNTEINEPKEPRSVVTLENVTDKDLAEASEKLYKTHIKLYAMKLAEISDVYKWSLTWAVEDGAAHHDERAEITAYEQHLARMEDLYKSLRGVDVPRPGEIATLEYYILEAKKLLCDAKRKAQSHSEQKQ